MEEFINSITIWIKLEPAILLFNPYVMKVSSIIILILGSLIYTIEVIGGMSNDVINGEFKTPIFKITTSYNEWVLDVVMSSLLMMIVLMLGSLLPAIIPVVIVISIIGICIFSPMYFIKYLKNRKPKQETSIAKDWRKDARVKDFINGKS